MGEQGGLRTGWIAAFGTEGYEGEPPLLEELGVNFGHIKGKVRWDGKSLFFLCAHACACFFLFLLGRKQRNFCLFGNRCSLSVLFGRVDYQGKGKEHRES